MTLENLHEWINQLTTLENQTPVVVYNWHKLYSEELIEKITDLGYSRHLAMIVIKTNKGLEYESVPAIIDNIYQIQLMDNEYFQGIRKLSILLKEKEEELENRCDSLKQTLWKCLICKKDQPNILYLPCGHIIHCKTCFNDHTSSIKCAACQMIIEESCTIYV